MSHEIGIRRQMQICWTEHQPLGPNQRELEEEEEEEEEEKG